MNCINSIGNELTKKNFFLAVEPFLDNRKNVLGMDGNVPLLCCFLICHKKTSRKLLMLGRKIVTMGWKVKDAGSLNHAP
jgi:hypothetical protein